MVPFLFGGGWFGGWSGEASLGADQPRERLVGLDKLSRSRNID